MINILIIEDDRLLNEGISFALKSEGYGISSAFNGDDIKFIHDSKWTQEAIFNILDNAIKYSLENTEIDIH